MPRFVFQVRDAAGANNTGALTAGNIDEASQMLRNDGKTIINIREELASAQGDMIAHARRRRIKHDDVIYFATQLAVMVDTGVPLAEALDAIVDQTDHLRLKTIVEDISDQVKAGVEFSSALEKYPKVFGKLFVALMKASEVSGTMGQMLLRVSEYLEQERDTMKKVKGALTYPSFMLGFCVMTVVSLLVFVLPRFEKIYSSKGAVLPMPTRILLGMSNGLINYWPYIICILVGAGVGLFFYLRTPAGRIMTDRIRIHVPIVGGMYRKSYLARSLRTMSTMVTSGVSIIDGLEITAQVAGNYFYSKIWTDLIDHVKEGSTLSDPLRECSFMPRVISQMISAGERTGKLGQVMDRVATFCEKDLRVAVKTATQMIEPFMIVFMGLLIGAIAIALLLPIFSISKVIAH